MKTAKILIIDDEISIQQVLTTWLKLERYLVETALTGEEGLEKAASWTPDLIILDVMLPGLSGLEVCHRLKTSRKTRSIPVIILSAKAQPQDRVQGLRAGAYDYILKPFEQEEALVRIQNMLTIRKLQKSLRRRMERYRRLSITDSLTGLINRREAENQLGREIKRARRAGTRLVFIAGDIDRFKEINDNFGHKIGDFVLRTIARLIRKTIPRDNYLARPAGDEFWLIGPGFDLEGAYHLCENLRRLTMAEPVKYNRLSIPVTISWGLSELRLNSRSENTDRLIEEADQALYHSKGAGRNRTSIFQKP